VLIVSLLYDDIKKFSGREYLILDDEAYSIDVIKYILGTNKR
jgi:hypothetical protein